MYPLNAIAASPQQVQSEKQTVTVQGTVLEAQTNEPLIGASVLVKGTSTGTTTDIDGNFTLKVPAGSTLVVSYVGFNTFEGKAQSKMNITLSSSANELEEMVVVGYGVQKKASVTGAVSTV
ncbi:MAG: carboxypeptidase-like regulatory domain-containing protein, partial [Muribaculaceae bacterium]|nr:carboxypeptidase-like regulatory domain-containing protein [Muribaculaceae bacterium]